METTARSSSTNLNNMLRSVRVALLATATLALALQAAATTSLGHSLSTDEHATLMAISMGAAVIAALLSAARAPQHRPALLTIAAGLSLYALGDAYFFMVQKTPTFPTISDFLWLSFYPLLVTGLVLIIRSETPGQRLEVWLEGAIVALTATAASYALLEPILSTAINTPAVVAGQLAYPLLDLGTLTLLVISGLGTRGGLRPGYLLIGLGMVVLLVTDLASLHQAAAETYVPGTLLDCGWSAAVLLIALALQLQGPILRPRVLEGRSFYLLVLFAVSASVALSVIVGVANRDPVVLTLTALVPVLVVARLLFSIGANQRLADDNAAIIATAGAGILSVDRDGHIVSVNPAAAKMLGWGQAELMGRDSHSTIHHKRVNGTPYPRSKCPALQVIESGEIQRVTGEVFWRKDGTSFPVDYTCSPIRDEGVIVGAVIVFDDVSRQRRLQATLRYQADHDHLTGLHNRRYLVDQASEQLRRARRERRPGALAIIDLDAIKFVNDSFGHSAGDELLRKVASILTLGVRGTDVVARLGGDEFAVLLCEVEAPAATGVIEGLLEQDQAGELADDHRQRRHLPLRRREGADRR